VTKTLFKLIIIFLQEIKNSIKMKNYITEFIGTFFLVLAIGLTGNPIAIGAMLMVMVYMGGHISGAHYNPAVSIAMIIRGLLSVKEAINYILSQLAGAILAALLVNWLGGAVMEIAPSNSASVLQILVVEAIFTFALVLVILNVATNPKTEGNSYYGLAIGLTIMAAAFAGGGISGGVYNPAVGIGPILIDAIMGDGGTLSNLWYYLIGPIAGAVLATYVYKLIAD
jgi:aquaporin Z